MEPWHIPAAVIATSVIACFFDLRSRRIPNLLTFGSAAAALVSHALGGGWAGLTAGLWGWVVGAALFFPFFVVRGMGAGDVKLLAALGAWLGPAGAFWLAIYSAMAGGVMGLIVAAVRGYLWTAFTNLFALVGYWLKVGLKPHPSLVLDGAPGPRLAYAVPVLAGVLVTLWLQ